MKTVLMFAASGILALTLGACATGTSDEQADSQSAVTSNGACEGVRVVVDFASLEAEPVDECVAAGAPITALQALREAGLEFTGSDTAGENFVCRVEGRPSETEQVQTETQGPDVQTCEQYGLSWAFWSVFVETGSGWTPANEGIATQKVKPGESLGLVWQLTDDAINMDAWQTPNV